MTGPRAVTIIGRSHTGSTLLSLLLAGRRGVVAVGEAWAVPEIAASDPARAASEPCSCGVTAASCPVWGRVLADLDAAPTRDPYPALVAAVEAVSGPEVVLVDESKSLGALRYLRQAVGEVTVVRLSRDVRADVSGRLRRADRYRPANRRDVVGQLRFRRASSATLAFADWYRDHRRVDEVLGASGLGVVPVSYEQLTAAPSVEVPALARALRLPSPDRVDLSAAGSHLVFGNNMRRDHERSSTVRADIRWLDEPRWTLPSLWMRPVMRYNSDLVRAGSVAARTAAREEAGRR